MYKPTLQTRRKLGLLVIAGLILTVSSDQLYGQQHVINKKDVTRPETSRQFNSFNLSSFTAIQQNGQYEMKWPASKDAGKKIIIEYSFDGINFFSGPEVLSNDAVLTYKHQMQDTKPMLYRLRTEDVTGAISHSGAFMPKGMTVSPVQVQSNIVNGNIINATAQFPVERIAVVSGDGVQVFTKDMNGQRDFIPVAIPSLKRGIYFVTFYGNGWNSTSRFLIG